MTPKETRNRLLADKLAANLRQRHFNAFYCATAKEAVEKISGMIPDGSSVTWGGSMTIRDMGLTKALHERNLTVWDRDEAPTREAAQEIYRRAFSADYYLSGVNAISESGVVVNIDGNGNRVAAMCFGPRQVVVVAGMNKVLGTLDDAVARARNVAAPANAQRFGVKTPCGLTGQCGDCTSPDCICSKLVITRFCMPERRIKVVLVGEDLGL